MESHQTSDLYDDAGDELALANGTTLELRPLGPDDRSGFERLFHRLSPASRHSRYMSPKRALTAKELTYLTDIDHLHHEAIAAVDRRDGSIVGVGRYVEHAQRPGVADLAVEVVDELQSMNLGTVLASSVVQRARANGFAVLTASALWGNVPARSVLRRLGFRTLASHGGEIEMELALGRAER